MCFIDLSPIVEANLEREIKSLLGRRTYTTSRGRLTSRQEMREALTVRCGVVWSYCVPFATPLFPYTDALSRLQATQSSLLSQGVNLKYLGRRLSVITLNEPRRFESHSQIVYQVSHCNLHGPVRQLPTQNITDIIRI